MCIVALYGPTYVFWTPQGSGDLKWLARPDLLGGIQASSFGIGWNISCYDVIPPLISGAPAPTLVHFSETTHLPLVLQWT